VQKIVIDELRCKGCGLCTIACPKDLLRLSPQLNKQGYFPAEITPEKMEECISCALCAQMCPDVAIEVHKAKPAAD